MSYVHGLFVVVDGELEGAPATVGPGPNQIWRKIDRHGGSGCTRNLIGPTIPPGYGWWY